MLAGTLLFEFARHGSGVRDQIAHNFIARSHLMISGIFRLLGFKAYGDCWILHRSLLDRLFHLDVLKTTVFRVSPVETLL